MATKKITKKKNQKNPVDKSKKPLRLKVEKTVSEYLNIFVDDYVLHKVTPNNLYKLILAEVEPPLLEAVMRFTNGNQSDAAKILGMNRTTLRTKLKKYNIK